VFSVARPSYKTILELDRKVREHPVPELLGYRRFTADDLLPANSLVSLQRTFVSMMRESSACSFAVCLPQSKQTCKPSYSFIEITAMLPLVNTRAIRQYDIGLPYILLTRPPDLRVLMGLQSSPVSDPRGPCCRFPEPPTSSCLIRLRAFHAFTINFSPL
jgi:hypothetical protein